MKSNDKGNMNYKLLFLLLLIPLLASCGGRWASKCTQHSTAILSEEKTAVVGSEMVQVGCFSRIYVRGDEIQKDIDYAPIVESELIYSGRAGNILFIAYREYGLKADAFGYVTRPSYARQAFYQHVQYDLSTSDIIVFQNWVIQVLDADNQQIRFIVTKEPLTAW